MSKFLSLAALTALAVTEVFDKRADVDKCFGTADGNLFLPNSLNAARNHGRQEKLEVHEISRSGADSTDTLEHIETDAEANEKKLEGTNAAAATAAAAAGNKAPAKTAAVSPESGALAQAKGKAKAEKATGKAKDAPATDGKPAAKKAAAKPAPAAPAAPAGDAAPAAPTGDAAKDGEPAQTETANA